MPSNGHDEYAEERRELRALVTRLNDTLRDFFEEQRRSSGLLERAGSALDALREKDGERHTAIVLQLGAIESLISRIREDTDPRGHALLDSASLKSQKNDSGGAIVAAARLAEKVPASWAGALFKLGVSAGLGGALMRLAQFFLNGH
jgi:hypothetical protein